MSCEDSETQEQKMLETYIYHMIVNELTVQFSKCRPTVEQLWNPECELQVCHHACGSTCLSIPVLRHFLIELGSINQY